MHENRPTGGRADLHPGLMTRYNLWRRVGSYMLFVRRRVVEATGDFDEMLGLGSPGPWGAGEDLDYVHRCLVLNLSLYYDPTLLVYHPKRRERSARPSPKDGYQYGMGLGRALRKQPHAGVVLGVPLLSCVRGGAPRAHIDEDRRGLVSIGPLVADGCAAGCCRLPRRRTSWIRDDPSLCEAGADGARAPTSLPELVSRRASAAPEAVAFLSPGRTVTYGELLGHCEAMGELLGPPPSAGRTASPSSCRTGPPSPSRFSRSPADAVFAPLNPSYTRAELEFYLADLDARRLSPARASRERCVSLRRSAGWRSSSGTWLRPQAQQPAQGRAPTPDDPALVLHTSGTTARPKIVPLTHRNLCVSAQNVASTLALTEDDRCLNVMPLFHIHGLIGVVLASLWAGGSVVCTAGFHAPSFLDSLEEWAPTWYSAVPTMHQAVLARVRARQRQSARRTRCDSSARRRRRCPFPCSTASSRRSACP